MNFPVFLTAKYLKPKRSVASVITCVSILGVMLGVAAVIIVRSVMTGFGDEWEKKILSFKPHVSLIPMRGHVVQNEDAIAEAVRSVDGVTCVTPEIDTRVMLSYNGRVLAPVLLGVDADAFSGAYKIGAPRAGTFDLDGDSIVLGVHAARQLGCWVGDEVTVYSPRTLTAQDEVYLPIKWAQAAPSGPRPPVPLRALTWREADRELFAALAVEKNMTAVLLLLISLVALFCVMNTLLVLTVQKTPEIGLLKALGFSRREIMGVFMVHGLVQCTAGIALGLLASWAVLTNLQRIVEWLGSIGVPVFPESVYGLAEIPHRVIVSDIVWTVAIVYAFGWLASFIPALIASTKDPVKALET